jgi:hypothetical protein
MSVFAHGNQRGIIVHIPEEAVEGLLPPFSIVTVLILLLQLLTERQVERKVQILQLRTQLVLYL